jgi:hypothetical protein
MKMSSVNYARARMCAALICISVLVLSSCAVPPNIAGTWRKLPEQICGEIYPDKVIFLEDGTYVGGMLSWNGGKYDIVGGSKVKLDTRSGPGLYEYNIANNVLTFKTDWGCEFKYAKVK